jgi:hypothetical protein
MVCILALAGAAPVRAQPAVQWKEAKSTHFIIYYKNAPEEFISQVTAKSEYYYDSIAEELGFRRFNFWLWDNRAKIYIYDNDRDFQSGTGQPPWAIGDAVPKDKVIRAFPLAQNFFEVILPHEISHIIFREFVGFENYAVPLWLDEGVASYYQKLQYSGIKMALVSAKDSRMLMGVPQLTAVRSVWNMGKDQVKLFYMEAINIVDFLFKEYGKDSFVLFCQNLRDKKDLVRALSSTYPISSLQELDTLWQHSLQR